MAIIKAGTLFDLGSGMYSDHVKVTYLALVDIDQAAVWKEAKQAWKKGEIPHDDWEDCTPDKVMPAFLEERGYAKNLDLTEWFLDCMKGTPPVDKEWPESDLKLYTIESLPQVETVKHPPIILCHTQLIHCSCGAEHKVEVQAPADLNLKTSTTQVKAPTSFGSGAQFKPIVDAFYATKMWCEECGTTYAVEETTHKPKTCPVCGYMKCVEKPKVLVVKPEVPAIPYPPDANDLGPDYPWMCSCGAQHAAGVWECGDCGFKPWGDPMFECAACGGTHSDENGVCPSQPSG